MLAADAVSATAWISARTSRCGAPQGTSPALTTTSVFGPAIPPTASTADWRPLTALLACTSSCDTICGADDSIRRMHASSPEYMPGSDAPFSLAHSRSITCCRIAVSPRSMARASESVMYGRNDCRVSAMPRTLPRASRTTAWSVVGDTVGPGLGYATRPTRSDGLSRSRNFRALSIAARPEPGAKLSWSTASSSTRPGVAAAVSSTSFELK